MCGSCPGLLGRDLWTLNFARWALGSIGGLVMDFVIDAEVVFFVGCTD